MQEWTSFLGGVMVGLGIGVFAFFAMTWWWMHHMFIMGVTDWPRFLAGLIVPVLLIVAGFGLVLANRHRRQAR
jgi:TRAP-type C4-dicarboxylate transport system permease small subunit